MGQRYSERNIMKSDHSSQGRAIRQWRVAAMLGLAVSLASLQSYANDAPTAPVGVDAGRVADFMKNAQKALDNGDLRLALIELKNAARTAPANTEVRIKLAEVELRAGDSASAEREVRQAATDGADKQAYLPTLLGAILAQGHGADLLTEFPDPAAGSTEPTAADILRARAEALDHLGKIEEASAAMTRSLSLRRDTATLLSAATFDVRRRQPAEADKLIEEILAKDPDNLQAILIKIDVRKAANDRDALIPLADKAVEIDKHGIRGRLVRTSLYFEQKNDAKALEDIGAILKVLPQQPLALYYKAMIQARAHDAKGAWEIAQSLPPDFVGGQTGITLGVAGIAMQSGNVETAVSLLSALITKSPTLAPPRLMLAAIRLQQTNPQAASEILAPLKDSNDAHVLALLAQTAVRLHKFDEAATYFQRASAAAPDSELLKTELAVSELRSGQEEAGVGQLLALTEQDPKRPETAALLIATLVREGKFDQALAAVDKMEVQGPLPRLYRGQVKAAEGDLPGAIEAFRSAITEDSTFTPARFELAQTLVRQGNTEEARAELDKIVQADPKSVHALLAEAELSAREDKPADTIALLRKAMTADPTDKQAPLTLANYQTLQGHLPDAQKTVEDLLKTDPDLPAALDMLGRIQLQAGDKLAAVATFQRLTAKLPQSAQEQLRLAGAFDAAGNRSSAVAAVQQALAINPDYVQANEALIAFKLAAGDKEGAIQVARDFQARNAGAGTLLLANTLMSSQRADEASRLLEASFAKRPDADTLLALAGLDVRANHADQARKRLADWLKDHPQNLAVARSYAALLLQADDRPGAIAAYEKILSHDAYDAMALNNLGELVAKDDPQRALGLLTLAAKIAPRSADIIDSLGWLKYEGGDHDTGLAMLTRAHALASGNSEITYHLAIAMDGTGNRADAKKLLEPLVAGDTKFTDQAAAKKLLESWH
jgi:putative PEP-CTERM system TPR-repeat lipoprotein